MQVFVQIRAVHSIRCNNSVQEKRKHDRHAGFLSVCRGFRVLCEMTGYPSSTWILAVKIWFICI